MTHSSGRPATGRGAVRRAGLLALLATLTVALVGFVPATAAQADPPQSRARQAIVKAALGEVGKRESGNNYYPTKYKLSKSIVRPAEWCGVFVNWAWSRGVTKRPNATAPKKGPAVDQLHWATYWQKWGKKNGRWKAISKRNPLPGDAIVYGNYPASVHVGLVVAVRYDKKGKVTQVRTVEGNVGDKVTNLGWRKITNLTGRGKKATGFVSPV